MSRALWKGNFIEKYFFRKKNWKKKLIWSRSSTITSLFLGCTVFVHTGKEFKKLYITKNKIGFKFGQFIFTRKHIKKNKVNKKK